MPHKDPARAREWRRAYYKRAHIRARENLRYHTANGQRWHLKNRYGITPEEWQAQFEKQGCVCGICARDKPDRGRWHVDHDHTTGKFRGILCRSCNVGLGHLKDDAGLLRLALDYLVGPDASSH